MTYLLIILSLILFIFTIRILIIRQKIFNRDPRINTTNVSIKAYLLILLSMAVFSAFQLWQFQEYTNRVLLENNTHVVISFLVLNALVFAVFIIGLIEIIRSSTWGRPMKEISEAARKVAKGDFSIRISPLRKDGKKDYVEVIFDDFNTMAQELQSIETLKDDFIANVSHEIKTPLAVIQGYATALQNDKLNMEDKHDYINTIVEASQKLSALVSNILKLNKLENQEILLESHPFNLTEQIRRNN